MRRKSIYTTRRERHLPKQRSRGLAIDRAVDTTSGRCRDAACALFGFEWRYDLDGFGGSPEEIRTLIHEETESTDSL